MAAFHILYTKHSKSGGIEAAVSLKVTLSDLGICVHLPTFLPKTLTPFSNLLLYFQVHSRPVVSKMGYMCPTLRGNIIY